MSKTTKALWKSKRSRVPRLWLYILFVVLMFVPFALDNLYFLAIPGALIWSLFIYENWARSETYVVTETMVKRTKIWFGKRMQNLYYKDMKAVELQQNLTGRIFDYGNIKITMDNNIDYQIKEIKDPNYIYEMIDLKKNVAEAQSTKPLIKVLNEQYNKGKMTLAEYKTKRELLNYEIDL